MSRGPPLVLIGPHTISWNYFASLRWASGEEHLFQHLRGNTDYHLSDLLRWTQDFDSGNLKDRVYALLGLVAGGLSYLPLEVDYSKHFTLVHAEAAVYMVRKEPTLDLLLDKRRRRTKQGSLAPSWCTDFTEMLPKDYMKGANEYNVCPGPPQVELLASRPKERTDLATASTSDIPCVCGMSIALRVKGLSFGRVIKKAQIRDLPATRLLYDFEKKAFFHPDVSGIDAIIGTDLASDLEKPALLKSIARHVFKDRIDLGEKVKEELSQGYQTTEVILDRLGFNDSAQVPNHYPLPNAPLLGMLYLDYIFDGNQSITASIGMPGPAMSVSRSSRERLLDSAAACLSAKLGLESSDRSTQDLSLALRWEYVMTYHSDTSNVSRDSRLTKSLVGSTNMKPFINPSTNFVTQAPPGDSQRAFFRTEDGFMGLGSNEFEVGDDIWVPFGSSLPWIVSDHGDHYQLKGHAVIPGIMSGQLVDLCDAEAVESHDFVFKYDDEFLEQMLKLWPPMLPCIDPSNKYGHVID